MFQGLAADGAKLALWHVWRAGYKITNFVHDELVVAVPKNRNLAREAEQIAQLMRTGMQEVVPDIRIDVEWDLVDRWSKDASVELDEAGYLVTDLPSGDLVQVGDQQVVCLGGVPAAMSPLSSVGSTV